MDPKSDTMEISWEVPFPMASMPSVRPLIRDDTAYVGWQRMGGLGMLYSLDVERGEEKWVAEYEGGALVPGSVTRDQIYAGSPDGFHSFDVETGGLSMSFKPEGEWRFINGVHGGDRLYVVGMGAGEEDTIYGIDPETGEIEWEFRSDYIAGLFAIQGDSVYITGKDKIHRLLRVDGSEVWSVSAGPGYINDQVIANGEIIYGIGRSEYTGEHKISAIEDSCGSIDWSVVSGENGTFGGMAASENALYVSSQVKISGRNEATARMIALDQSGGSRLWTSEAENMKYATTEWGNPIMINGQIYVGELQDRINRSDIASMKILDGITGELIRTIQLYEASIFLGPSSVSAGKDTIYSLIGGTLRAIR